MLRNMGASWNIEIRVWHPMNTIRLLLGASLEEDLDAIKAVEMAQ